MRHKVTEGKRVTFECDKIFHTCTRSEIHGDEIEELGGDTCIDPLNDSKIVLHPPWIARLQRRGRIDVMLKTRTTKVNMKQVAPE
jgi:hypothetical protein